MNSIYCDHAATTPCRPEVWDALRRCSREEFGNPSSLHAWGGRAREATEQARGRLARQLNAGSHEIIFTSGGTESIHLALRGALLGCSRKGEIVTTCIEHEATMQSCESLRHEGFSVRCVLPDEGCYVSPESVAEAITAETRMVSIIYVNNETGVVQPIREIVHAVRQVRPSVLVHVDAVQAVGHMTMDVQALDVDLLSLTAHKFYGPKGVGALFVRDGIRMHPEMRGGGQECGIRGGTESVPLLVGMATALELASADMSSEPAYWAIFRKELEDALLRAVPSVRVNGSNRERLSHFTNLSVKEVEGDDLVLALDRMGIAASSRSACSLSGSSVSHVLQAMGLPRSWAIGSLRFSFGHASRGLTPDHLVRCVANSISELRRIHSATGLVA